MGFFDRFKRVVKSNLNEMISKAEDPQKMLNQVIIEMNENLVENKKVVASAIADEKKLERQINEQLSNAKKWEEKAELAVRAGKDGLAREALLRKREFDTLVQQYKDQWEAQHGNVEQLKGSLRQLQLKIEEAQRKKNLLIARTKRAEAQKKIQSTMSKMKDTSAFEAFERMNQKVEQIEAEAEASKEIDDIASGGDDLEKRFTELEGGSPDGDLLLEDFKKQLENK